MGERKPGSSLKSFVLVKRASDRTFRQEAGEHLGGGYPREGWMGSSGGIPAIRGSGLPFPFVIERFFWGHVHHANLKSRVEYSSRW
ncbi:hypothetical protein TNIN_352841 [Trichonephila inaurata madagascariensis]|uniref:Uncharacterized protein n=1 Tax=Trichonephila inaurata madagascariensis TaxID=2747483 RepID=A0A8X7CGM9_9ARAC|nr:hypothetical protein TNIN_352841 [Trichonephila inaurata madagascariensis]